jgi:hypothetical protein
MRIPVDSVISLIRVRKGNIVKGAVIGGLIGFGVGGLTSAAASSGLPGVSAGSAALAGGAIAGGIGAVIGIGIGALIPRQKIYPLETLSLSDKSKAIGKHCLQ